MTRKIVDLSLTFREGMRGVGFEPANRIANGDSYNTTTLSLYSHAGTHMDAPRHFIDDGGTIDNLDLEKCIGPALVLDLTAKPANSLITVNDIAPWADRIGQGTRLLLRTDWDQHADLPDYRTHFPRISLELAQWLADRGVWLVGVQGPSVASLVPEFRQELIDVHQTLLAAAIVIVEGLANLDVLDVDEIQLIALPLKIDGCDGSPTRPVAIIDSASETGNPNE